MANALTVLGAPELPKQYTYKVQALNSIQNEHWVPSVRVSLMKYDHRIRLLRSESYTVDFLTEPIDEENPEAQIVRMCDNLYMRNFPPTNTPIDHLIGTYE